ncbi:hypothetical protein EYF80_026943 [Liparis tanakae]|uniref:Uncharacterized protein n=1 Tax=Liparis tanakae TaxID=230148 RepID=A0A4Z2HAG5_9TELE|nr:hypothetical protein EYF80_026943 [Liparis tanakae]
MDFLSIHKFPDTTGLDYYSHASLHRGILFGSTTMCEVFQLDQLSGWNQMKAASRACLFHVASSRVLPCPLVLCCCIVL